MPTIASNAWTWLQGELGFVILIFLGIGGAILWIKKETSKLVSFILMALLAVMFVFQGANVITFLRNAGNMLLP